MRTLSDCRDIAGHVSVCGNRGPRAHSGLSLVYRWRWIGGAANFEPASNAGDALVCVGLIFANASDYAPTVLDLGDKSVSIANFGKQNQSFPKCDPTPAVKYRY
jgi:hypothetical protein